jgi:energy-coupling factor transporter ATP-binding protein EcfA2
VRYEWYGVPYERHGRNAGVVGGSQGLFGITGTDWDDLYQPGVTRGRPTDIELVGKNSPNPDKKLYNDDWNNFAPAVGLSWSLPWFGKDKTVLRAGYGINYHGAASYNAGLSLLTGNNQGLSYTQNLTTLGLGATYLNFASTNLPVPVPTPTGIAPLSREPFDVRTNALAGYDDNRVNPYVQNWNLEIQREIARNFTFEARYDDIVSFAGLEGFIDEPVKNYSSGMYVRLGFSVAINVDPDVLLIDEVLAVGDAEFQQRCTDKIIDLKKQGRTIVVVSHSMDSVRDLCDQVALLEHGRLVTVGPAVDVIDEYLVDVFHDETFDVQDGARWGSGEIRIDRAELLGPDGKRASILQTGEPLVVRMHYTAHERVPSPVFGIGIHAADGAYVAGPNTRDCGYAVESVDGEGIVEVRIERLMLVPGTYAVTVAVHDETGTHPFDFRQKLLSMQVELGKPRDLLGYLALDTQWDVTAASEGSTVR